MTIHTLIQDQVNELLKQDVTSERQQLHLQLPKVDLELVLTDVQPLGCAIWQLEVRSDRTATTDTLHEAGQQLADRVKYLLEPLRVHEIDPESSSVQLRSFPPERKDQTVRYYEVTAENGGRWKLARYEKQPGESRQQVPAIVTIQVLKRLCQDVVDIATQ